MHRTIVAFRMDNSRQTIAHVLEKNGIAVQYLCASGAEVLRIAGQVENAVVICAYRLTDMTANQLADALRPGIPCLVVAKPAQLALCERSALHTLAMPAPPAALVDAVHTLFAVAQRSHAPHRTAQEQALIDRAVTLLIQDSCMSESEAYRYIQHKSMDTTQKMTQVAQKMIASLEERRKLR